MLQCYMADIATVLEKVSESIRELQSLSDRVGSEIDWKQRKIDGDVTCCNEDKMTAEEVAECQAFIAKATELKSWADAILNSELLHAQAITQKMLSKGE